MMNDVGEKRALRRLIVTQVVIATIACGFLVALALTIRPLLNTKSRLEAEIKVKQREIVSLEHKLAARRREIDAAERTLESVARKHSQTKPVVNSPESDSGPQHKIAVTAIEAKTGYVLVLGSYKGFTKAIDELPVLASQTGEKIRLFYSLTGYFVPVIGPIPNRPEAEQLLDRIRLKIPDAFVFTAGAFPYEIDLGSRS
jgi:hypothetical protein